MRRWLILLFPILVSAPASAARLTGVSMTPGVVTISADAPPVVAHQFALAGPYRLVIDLPAMVETPLFADGAGSVTRLRAAMFSPGVARLVIDLAGPLEVVSARTSARGLTLGLRRIADVVFAENVKRGRRPLPLLSDGAVTPAIPAPPAPPAKARTPVTAKPSADFSLPSDMFAQRLATPPPTAARTPAIAPPAATDTPASAPPTPVENTSLPPPRLRAYGIKPRSAGRPLVVIDAGHGGKDIGATSINGGHEKDVTLAIARATARRLERRGKVRVKLTRGDDRFIALGGRVTIARLARADLFISIHADSAANGLARGASVYTLSAIASDAVAARLAARENKSDIIGGVNLGLEAPEVGDIMIDLSRRATGNVSVAFAEILQDALSSRIKFRGEFHRFAGFRILKAPDVPSVLIETGYVSNSDDSDLLFSDAGRKRIADGIAGAIERHLLGD